MSTLAIKLEPLAQSARCTADELIVSLLDGRAITVPLLWFPRLSNASEEQRNHIEILGNGEGLHWPDVDEDLSVNGLL